VSGYSFTDEGKIDVKGRTESVANSAYFKILGFPEDGVPIAIHEHNFMKLTDPADNGRNSLDSDSDSPKASPTKFELRGGAAKTYPKRGKDTQSDILAMSYNLSWKVQG